MGGIEPPSTAEIVSLLRVLLIRGVLLGSDLCYQHLSRQAQSEFKSRSALRHNTAASPLNDARTRSGDASGLTDFRLA